ncbi:MAG: sodium:solute symporter family protein [Candidatus Marinimicrobia bacterium]|nr:sodium:solute symporter family protein [Candidatus Neomarinimicrobiota bacterium]MCF7828354.1 sodium:solute symporter family protein [Candidatus Neomarinimicrobiota bacterium]MCF7881053.1 sodium:solute symporter family protein [Candidatus Neomarinimicrobiota bacterium]
MPEYNITVSLHPIDYLLIGAYIVALVIIGFRFARSKLDQTEDYLLASRALTLPGFVATLVSTWYGGILGVGEFSYQYGLSNWIVFGVPYYIFAGFFALFLAKKVRDSNLYTIPDRLYQYYDKKTGLLGAFFTFLMVSPAPYILMLGILINLLFGWTLLPSIIVGTLFSIAYVYFGGFRSVLRTDYLQFGLMFAGFLVMVYLAFQSYGGLDFLQSVLPESHLSWSGGNSIQYILVWFFIAIWTLVDPGFHQRCYGAQSGKVAKNGILISIVFWAIFDFLTTTTGLYARAILTDVPALMSYPLLAEELLPPILKGLFYVGLIAVIMSTIDSFSFLSAVTIGRDFLWRLFGDPDNDRSSFYSRIGLIITGVVAVLMVITIPSVIDLWYTIGTLLIPALIYPLLATYFSRRIITGNTAFMVSLTGFAVSALWYGLGMMNQSGGWPQYPLGIEPLYPGLLAGGVIYFVGWVIIGPAKKRTREV